MKFTCKNDFYRFIGKQVADLAREIGYCFDEMPVADDDRKRFIGVGSAEGWDVDVYFGTDGVISNINIVYEG